jgi:hypothetical protein
MSASSDERAVAQLVKDMLSTLTPVPTFNDGTRDYTWRPANGFFVLLGTEANAATTWRIDPSVGGDTRVVTFSEIVDGVTAGHWKFHRVQGPPFGDAWLPIENNPEGSLSVPPAIPPGFDFFESSPSISGIEQIALAGDDDDLTLPAIVVRATFEEEARALKKNGNYGGRYRVDIELRGIRTKPGTAASIPFFPRSNRRWTQSPILCRPAPLLSVTFSSTNALAPKSITDEETRELTRSYSIFAWPACKALINAPVRIHRTLT